MDPIQPVLSLAAATTAAAALSMALFGRGRRHFGGWALWVGSLWAVAAGAAVAALFTPAAVVAELLWLQWPIVSLAGVRRFHSRLTLPGDIRRDLGVLGAAAAIAVSSLLWGADTGPRALAPAAASTLVHLYAASLMWSGPDTEEGMPLRWLGANYAAAAVAPVLLAVPSAEVAPGLLWRGIAAALASIVCAFIVLGLVNDRTERQLRDSRRRLRMLANIDALTKVPNRRHFEELAARVLGQDLPGTATLALVDVDHFKSINDRLGHAMGDRALRVVASALQDTMRTNDVPGRHGGDEFVLLLRDAAPADAVSVAERVTARVLEHSRELNLPELTLSFGIVKMLPGELLDDALARADQALYEAKRQGRSRAVTADDDNGTPVFSDSRRLGLVPTKLVRRGSWLSQEQDLAREI
jgi:diguanylate cyclase (GGDEF)-like protein